MKTLFALNLAALDQFPREPEATDAEPLDIAFLRAVAKGMDNNPDMALFRVMAIDIHIGLDGPYVSVNSYPEDFPQYLSERTVWQITITSKFQLSVTKPGRFRRRWAKATLDKYYLDAGGDTPDTRGMYVLKVTGPRLGRVQRLHADILDPSGTKAEKARLERWVK